jgi:branched-chain amino acid transport system substrate-binding protein
MKKIGLALLFAICLFAAPSVAADKVRVGFITTLSGPGGTIGKHMRDGAQLALDSLGGKLGGIEAEVIFGDDQQKPDAGRQLAEEMLKKDKVDFVAGVIWSNVLLSIYQPVIKSGAILISASAGPHQLAGAMCDPHFFSVGWQNDESAEAMGQYMTDQKIDNVFMVMPNYAAGKDMAEGFKRFYRGKLAAEVYTSLEQTDYQTELTALKSANPSAVFTFMPGGIGIQFIKQYDQIGLRGKIPLYSVFTQNEVILPALREAAIGNYETGFWSPDVQNPENQAFVAAFRKKYGYLPSEYAATAFDAIKLIDSALKTVHGDVADKKAVIAAMERADFASVRGRFRFNNNHFPIEDFYLFRIAKDASGDYYPKVEKVVFPERQDSYHGECKMH